MQSLYQPGGGAFLWNICPVCGKKLTIGVLHRVEQLADREEGFVLPQARPFESLVPLPEVIAASTGKSASSKKVLEQYEKLLGKLGPNSTSSVSFRRKISRQLRGRRLQRE